MAVLVESMAPSPFSVMSFAPPPRRPRRPLVELIKDANWNRVCRRVAKAPEDVTRPSLINLDGHATEAYPLHYLCTRRGVPLSVVHSFVSTWPDAVRIPDSLLDSLPIHIACEHDASADVLDVLVRAYPRSLLTPDREGNLPIHYACALESPDCALYLIAACPESVVATNKKKQTPLHLACSRYDISKEMVEALLKLSRGPCESLDWQGRLPIHSACMWKADTSIIAMLLHCCPHSVGVHDFHDMTPYGISRKLMHLDHSNPTIKLLRCYRKKSAPDLLVRGINLVQFQAENLCDSLGIHTERQKSFRRANAE